jgi:poly-beta-1,6-N-acetyl-D-glucosamine synthase
MWWIVGFSALIGILYLVLITIFSIGWKRTNAFIPSEEDMVDSLISVIVPCRDEENKICQLITSIKNQTYQNFELILVNDHSEDATRSYIEAVQPEFKNIRFVDAIGFGKKNALREGILQSGGDLVVTTDADCFHSTDWLQAIVAFQSKQPSDLVICPVRLSGRNSLFSNIQKLEFASLVASGAGAAGAGMPILCNGANLVFTKEVWLKSQTDLHDEEQSGDDIFLLESVKKRGGVIRFLKSEAAFAIATSADSLSSFFKQRRRWTSKAPAYTDWQIIFTACVIFTISLLEVVLLCLSVFDLKYLIPFLSLFLFKYLLDAFFLNSVSGFFRLKHVWFNSLILSVVYPFYIAGVALSALLIKPKRWK